VIGRGIDEVPARASATLAIRSTSLQPDEISQLLGLSATASQYLGSPDELDPLGGPLASNGWLLSSKAAVASGNVPAHLEWIMSQVAGKERDITRLRLQGCRVTLTGLWEADQEDERRLVYTLLPDLLSRIAAFGVGLTLVADMSEVN